MKFCEAVKSDVPAKVFVIQARDDALDDWTDYINHEDEKAAREILRTLQSAEERYLKSNRYSNAVRNYQLVRIDYTKRYTVLS